MTNTPLLVQAALGQKTARTPVWLMRQAGRYMHEYREFRKTNRFMDICRNPELSAKVSLMPYTSFSPDGVVMFSDIMFPLEDLGVEFALENAGPQIQAPYRSQEQLKKLHALDGDSPNVQTIRNLLKILRQEVRPDAAILGFCGGPFTLATYMVEGQKSEDLEVIKAMMSQDPVLLKSILKLLAENMTTYCLAQADAGADVIQIFDTWAGMLSEADFREFALPYLQIIFKALTPRIPTILYVKAATGYLDVLKESGAACISLDWRVSIAKARLILGEQFPIQGNLDPVRMLGTTESVERETKKIIQAGQHRAHILNLGHGLLPNTPRENVKCFIETAKQCLIA